jgi:hypothetical protein
MTGEQPKTHVDPRPLLGMDPDWTGGMCSVDYVRWQRDYEPDELEHEACADIARRWDTEQ